MNRTQQARDVWAKGFKKARARPRHEPGTMNKTEAAYAQYLEVRKRAGEIQSYDFEAMKLRLAKATFYTPDFMVITASGFVEFHEVKGFWEEDARVKIKTAAEKYPAYVFIAVSKKSTRDGGGWKVEEFEPF